MGDPENTEHPTTLGLYSGIIAYATAIVSFTFTLCQNG